MSSALFRTSSSKIIEGDCRWELRYMRDKVRTFDCCFMDPPDNIGLNYNEHDDRIPTEAYEAFLREVLYGAAIVSPIIWISFNAKWTAYMGFLTQEFLEKKRHDWTMKPCVQTFTFGQYNKNDLSNNHRPLWRFMHRDAELYPDNILVPSWREKNGDKRATGKGRVPGDVFDFPRVTGNSKQRRSWHPTQLNEKLVERCVLMSTNKSGRVLDPFGGTGTTLRVCLQHHRQCTIIEKDSTYCEQLRKEHPDVQHEDGVRR